MMIQIMYTIKAAVNQIEAREKIQAWTRFELVSCAGNRRRSALATELWCQMGAGDNSDGH